MPATLRSFAINAEDVGRARAFYGAVFGWTFEAWGPPDFYVSGSAGAQFSALLQGRHEIVAGVRPTWFQQTFGVDDMKATLRAVEAGGGRIVGAPAVIETVGERADFVDPEGNIVSIMRYVNPPAVRGPVSTPVRHFAINADDVQRAKAFYEQAFGWTFTPWGPPNFYQTRSAGEGLMGALQERREVIDGVRATSFEQTIAVEDLKRTIGLITANGGSIALQPYVIHGVGELIYFQDSEGLLAGAMQYAPGLFEP